MSESDAPEKKQRSRWWRIGGTGLAIAVIAVVFAFFLPKIASYASVWDVVKGFSWQDFALLVGATVLNLATFAPPWMAALPGLRFRQAFVVTQSSTALTVIAPGGPAVGMAMSFGMLRRLGLQVERRHARGRGDRRLEPVRDPRLPCDRARAPHRPRAGRTRSCRPSL